MRIAVDARELHGRPTGVGRFLSELLRVWKQSPAAQAHDFILCAPESGGAGTAWEQLTLPRLVRKARADVLFAPAYTAPLRAHVPVVLVVHDVSFCAHPEWFSWREGARRRAITQLAARRAARVITVSRFSKREITAHLGIDPAKVDVVYHGLNRPETPARSRMPPPRQSVLFVGSVFNRRHVPELIDAFTGLARDHQDLHLDIVGDNRTSPRIDLVARATETGAVDRIHIRSYVADDELERLYREASAFVFLSEYEGFGLTPLEALGAELPIAVLDTPVAREIYGDAACYVARPEPGCIADALRRVLFDSGARQRLAAARPQVLSRYSWEAAARQVLEILVASAAGTGARIGGGTNPGVNAGIESGRQEDR